MLGLGAQHSGRGRERPCKDLNFMFPTRGLITWGASQFHRRTPFLPSLPTHGAGWPRGSPSTHGSHGCRGLRHPACSPHPSCPNALGMHAVFAKGPQRSRLSTSTSRD